MRRKLMRKEELIAKRDELVMQRSGLKDQIENIEKGLGQIMFGLQVLEDSEKTPDTE